MVSPRHCTKDLREQVRDLVVSFESGETVTDQRVYPTPSADWRLAEVRYEVIKALADTDAGTIDIEAGSTTDDAITQISLPASTVVGTRGTATLSTTDSQLRIGAKQAHAYHAVTTAKTTAGGRVLLSLVYRVIEPGSAQN
jgi:hypothetical protein